MKGASIGYIVLVGMVFFTKDAGVAIWAVMVATALSCAFWMKQKIDELQCKTCKHMPSEHQSVDKEAYPYCTIKNCACLCYEVKKPLA